MPTLVLTQRYSPDSNAMWRAAIDAGWGVERLSSMRAPEGIGARDPVFYGDTLTFDAIRDDLGVDAIEPDAAWLPSLPEPYRRRDVALETWRQACARESPRFVKPPDDKWFPARVYDRGAALRDAAEPSPDEIVISSEPVRFVVEFRVFVVERRAVALSPYVRDGGIARDDDGAWAASDDEIAEARAFVDVALADDRVSLPPAVVVDVGLIESRGWAVVEANAAWASGICGCDPAAVLGALRRANVRPDALSIDDQRWARPRRM